jgi:exportin-T
VEKILSSIQDLLIIWSPTLTLNEINIKLSNSEDQLFLYETISVLIMTSNLQPTVKSNLMNSLLQPIVTLFPLLAQQYCTKTDENEKLMFAKCLNNTMLVASRASKGFSSTITLKNCNCLAIFLDVLRTFIPALDIATHKNLINAGVRQYMHRMVVCLDQEILEYLPITFDYLLKNNDAKDINEYLPLVNQIICKFKQQISGFMEKIFMQIFNNTFSIVYNTQIDVSDTQIVLELQTLQKSYYQFLITLINNDLMNVIASQGLFFK